MTIGAMEQRLGARLFAPVVPDKVRAQTWNQVCDDSRAVTPGSVFVAVPGMRVDGHDFVAMATEKGAVAVVVEREMPVDIPQLIVPDASYALGILAAYAANEPAQAMATIGITGTNGKTTTTYLVEAMLLACGRTPGVLGTVSYRWQDEEKAAPYTTPTPLVLQSTLKEMLDAGCDTAVLEVSSAALHMNRLVGTNFQVAAFSNLSQDHLDIHQTMDEYRDAKARLFRDHLAASGVAVVNVDDPAGAEMVRAAGNRRILRVSSRGAAGADIVVVRQASTVAGIEAEIQTPVGPVTVVCSALIGRYNVDNVALAVGIGVALELPLKLIANGIATMVGVPGRLERVNNGSGIDIFVDYAHTPDALENVLGALREVTRKRLLCVFGCGGDRDPDKRGQMGEKVAQGADLAIITSDNPRSEDPQTIIDMIMAFVPDPFFVDVDRSVAIRAAIFEAAPGDVVVIAGKGHETYQVLADRTIDFDDRKVASAACNERPSFTLKDVLQVTGGTCVQRERESFERVILDGRIARQGDLYVAIVGETLDGHDYCEQAIGSGASGVVVATGRGQDIAGATVIEVNDPRLAFGQLAKMHRLRQTNLTVVGITGSAGKTTTKELVACALGQKGRVHVAAGSLNNETGVPLTLLGIRPYHDFAVVEMGMRGPGEIAYLADLARPDIAVVVNAGTAHIGRLGSTDAIAQAKGEIFAPRNNGSDPVKVAVCPDNDARLLHLARRAQKILTFGETDSADVRLVSYEPRGVDGSDIRFAFDGTTYETKLPFVGRHNALNACCAIAVAVAAFVSPEDAALGLGQAKAPSMRSEILQVAGRNLLSDCYNANPASMRAALRTLKELGAGVSSVAVLGDMLELGEEAKASHKEIGMLAADLGIAVIALGEHAPDLVDGVLAGGGQALLAEDYAAAAQAVLDHTRPGDWVLLKASRGMALEGVAAVLGSEEVR